MNWLKSNIQYGRNLVDSSVEGARTAREDVLHGEPVGTFVARSAAHSWPSAAVGACVGLLCGYLANKRKRDYGTMAACSLVGGIIGFGAGVAWNTRDLTGGIARGAIKNAGAVRDARWLSKHPVNYG